MVKSSLVTIFSLLSIELLILLHCKETSDQQQKKQYEDR